MKPLQILLACTLLAAAPAKAALIYGLTCDNDLISFESSSPGAVTFIGNISQPGIVDIDFFPATGQLYGITSTGNTYEINIATAIASLLFTPSIPLNNITDFDFNPQADRMRLIGEVDQNFRMVPATTTPPSAPGTPGDVTVDGTFTNPAVKLVANAYSNNVDGTASTTLYSIDFMSDSLMIHSIDPQFNTVTPIGALGIKLGTFIGFDIDPDGKAFLNDNNNLYSVNLTNGAANLLGAVGGGHALMSIAAVPEPGSAMLAALGGLLVLRRSRRKARA